MARRDPREPIVRSIADATVAIETDDHPFSPRPCLTCAAITRWLQIPVGCVAVEFREARRYALKVREVYPDA